MTAGAGAEGGVSEREVMRIRELIEHLQIAADQYGPETEVVVGYMDLNDDDGFIDMDIEALHGPEHHGMDCLILWASTEEQRIADEAERALREVARRRYG